jgi:hypothetical protein
MNSPTFMKTKLLVKKLRKYCSGDNLTDEEVLLQWKELRRSDKDNHCLCGMAIVENCHIINTINSKVVIIGNHCVRRIGNKNMTLAFECMSRISKNKLNNGIDGCDGCGCIRCKCEMYKYTTCSKCDVIIKKDEMDEHCSTNHKHQYYDETKLTFGKYKGYNLGQMIRSPKATSYLKWIAKNITNRPLLLEKIKYLTKI